jgi:hypothetical protein
MVGMLGLSYPVLTTTVIRTRLLYPVSLAISVSGYSKGRHPDHKCDPFELRLIAPPVSPSVIQAPKYRKTSDFVRYYKEAHYFLTLFSSFTLVKREKLKILVMESIIDFNTILNRDTSSIKKNVTVLIDFDANQNSNDVVVHQAHRELYKFSVYSNRDILSVMMIYLKLLYIDFYTEYLYMVVQITVLIKLFLKESFGDYLTNKEWIEMIHLVVRIIILVYLLRDYPEDYLTNKDKLIIIVILSCCQTTQTQRACSASVCNNK